MEILIADREAPSAAAVARTLEAHGHVIRGCRDVEESGAAPCAALRGAQCPLDTHPIDAVVKVGPRPTPDPRGDSHLGDGDLCAVRRLIPLVLLDRPDDTLAPWAATTAAASEAVERVHEAILPLHTTRALVTARGELRQRGLDDASVDVEVRRRAGGLTVDLFTDGRLGNSDAEGLAVHVVQSVRLFDPWAKSIDASVHGVFD